MGMSSGGHVNAGTVVYGTDTGNTGVPVTFTIRGASGGTTERMFVIEGTDGTDIAWWDGAARLVFGYAGYLYSDSIAAYTADALAVSPLKLAEASAPAALANACKVWAEDNGAGKTRLMARFGSGADQQLAIEP